MVPSQPANGNEIDRAFVDEVRHALERCSLSLLPVNVLRAVLGWSGRPSSPLTRPCGARVASQLRDDENGDERERDDEDGTRSERVCLKPPLPRECFTGVAVAHPASALLV